MLDCVLAARTYGIDILDGVYNDLSDPEGFERECAQARDMGFDGKTLIHPNQIGPCNTAFSPSPEDYLHGKLNEPKQNSPSDDGNCSPKPRARTG